MGMGFASTWLRQVTPPPASHDHFNHCSAPVGVQAPKSFLRQGAWPLTVTRVTWTPLGAPPPDSL